MAEPQRVRLPARVDVGTSADVRAELHAALDGADGDLVLDLSGVELIDAAGLGVLVGVRRRAERDGRAVVLHATPARVRRLLAATRLARLFVVDDDPVGLGEAAPVS